MAGRTPRGVKDMSPYVLLSVTQVNNVFVADVTIDVNVLE